MAFEDFRRFLTTETETPTGRRALGAHAAGDYISRLRRFEALMETTVADAAPDVLRAFATDLGTDPRVKAAGIPPKVAGDIAVALRRYAAFRAQQAPPPVLADVPPPDIVTDAVALVRQRRAQAAFRAELMSFWQGRCPMTGVTNPSLLVASHIKPWRDSDDRERIDPFNGLLLATPVDAVFDRLLITFDANGTVLVAVRLTAAERSAFAIATLPARLLLHQRHLHYMCHHRARFLSRAV